MYTIQNSILYFRIIVIDQSKRPWKLFVFWVTSWERIKRPWNLSQDFIHARHISDQHKQVSIAASNIPYASALFNTSEVKKFRAVL